MAEYRKGSHSVFRLHVHIVWCTKYRKKVLTKDLAHRLRELIRQICSDLKVEIISGVVSSDHVHILVSKPPQVSESKIVQKVKGKSSYKLQREFPLLRSELGCTHSHRSENNKVAPKQILIHNRDVAYGSKDRYYTGA